MQVGTALTAVQRAALKAASERAELLSGSGGVTAAVFLPEGPLRDDMPVGEGRGPAPALIPQQRGFWPVRRSRAGPPSPTGQLEGAENLAPGLRPAAVYP